MLDWLLRYKRKPRDNEKFKPIAAYMREEIRVYNLLQDGLITPAEYAARVDELRKKYGQTP